MSNAVAIASTGSKGTGAMSVVDPTECALEPELPTVGQAHKIMQAHLRCRTAVCKHRKVALAVLVDVGRYALR